MPISDNFESLADGAALSDDPNWDVHIASGTGVPTMDQHDDHSDGSQVVDMSNTGDSYNVYLVDVGGDDHWCELDVFIDVDPSNANVCGPIARGTGTFAAGTFNGYAAWAEGLALGGGVSSLAVVLYVIENNVPTQLATTGDIHATYDAGLMHRIRLEINGDALAASIDGDEVLTATDATHTTGQRCGFREFREEATTFSQPFVDNFAGDTLGGGPSIVERAGRIEGTSTLDGSSSRIVNRGGTIGCATSLTATPLRIVERGGRIEGAATLTGTGARTVERSGRVEGVSTLTAEGQAIAEGVVGIVWPGDTPSSNHPENINYDVTPNDPSLHVLGDMAIVVEFPYYEPPMSADIGAQNETGIMDRYQTTGANRSWYIRGNPDGTFTFSWSIDGSGAGLTAAWSDVVGSVAERLVIAAALDVDDGSNQHVLRFLRGDTRTGPWSPIGVTVFPGITSVFAGIADLSISGHLSGQGNGFRGAITYAELRDGITTSGEPGGQIVASRDYTEPVASYMDPQGNQWEIQGHEWRWLLSDGSLMADRGGVVTGTSDLTGSGDRVATRAGRIDGTSTLDGSGVRVVDRAGRVDAAATLEGTPLRVVDRGGRVDAVGTLTAEGEGIRVVSRGGRIEGTSDMWATWLAGDEGGPAHRATATIEPSPWTGELEDGWGATFVDEPRWEAELV